MSDNKNSGCYRHFRKASEMDLDLIVVGKRGKSGLQSMLLGSVAKRVTQEAFCDVLVVEQEQAAG